MHYSDNVFSFLMNSEVNTAYLMCPGHRMS